MKLVAISDTHGYYRKLKLPKGDILVHAGDIGDFHDSEALQDFNLWLKDLPYKHKIVIAGNHDRFFYHTDTDKIKKMLTHCTYLENSGCTIKGVKFWGSPMTPRFMNWYFMADRGMKIMEYWKEIPKDTQVLIIHGPPYGILDYVTHTYGQHSVGCEKLLEKIKEIKPKYNIFGHIHSQRGIVKPNKENPKTTFINASVMDEEYDVVNKPIVVEI